MYAVPFVHHFNDRTIPVAKSNPQVFQCIKTEYYVEIDKEGNTKLLALTTFEDYSDPHHIRNRSITFVVGSNGEETV